MYAVRVPGAVNTQDVVWEFACAIYKNVILSLRRNVTLEPNCLISCISHSTSIMFTLQTCVPFTQKVDKHTEIVQKFVEPHHGN